MEITRLSIPEVILITPSRHGDARGFFSETWRDNWLDEIGVATRFIQDNHAKSSSINVVRGLHFQYNRATQAKLVRVITGAILDVAVDIRVGSPTYGQHVSVELSSDNWQQVFVPPGFAHGYCTLTEETEVVYKVDNYYTPELDAGIRWNDPALGIDWPCTETSAVLSQKDRELPPLSKAPKKFRYNTDQTPFPLDHIAEPEIRS